MNLKIESVSGLFYDADESKCQQYLSELLTKNSPFLPKPAALFVPHAGYVYSASIAAKAYAQIQRKSYRRVFILADNHAENFTQRGLGISPYKFFKIGSHTVPVDEDFLNNLQDAYPQWVHLNGAAFDTHVIEVQLPFLLAILKEHFSIVPLVLNGLSKKEIRCLAEFLLSNLSAEDLLVVSSDLSHYLPAENALVKDAETIRDILRGESIPAKENHLCGPESLACLQYIAKVKNWPCYFLGRGNSGDVNHQDGRVVGYGALAWTQTPVDWAPKLLHTLRRFALLNIQATLLGEKLPSLEVLREHIPQSQIHQSVFITLNFRGNLRGCIGSIDQLDEDIAQQLQTRALDAAFHDPRFPPLTIEEATEIDVHLSVLSFSKRVLVPPKSFAEYLAPLAGKVGVVLEIGNRRSTFLPEVWEELPHPIDFLNHLAEKQGNPPDAWKSSIARLYTYTTDSI